MLPSYRVCGINKRSLRTHRTRRLMPIQTHARPNRKRCRWLLLHILCPVGVLPVGLLHIVFIRNGRKSSSQSLRRHILMATIAVNHLWFKKKNCHLKETCSERCHPEANSGLGRSCLVILRHRLRLGGGVQLRGPSREG